MILKVPGLPGSVWMQTCLRPETAAPKSAGASLVSTPLSLSTVTTTVQRGTSWPVAAVALKGLTTLHKAGHARVQIACEGGKVAHIAPGQRDVPARGRRILSPAALHAALRLLPLL